MSFTKATYYKLAIILFLFVVIAIISSSIRLRLLGANIERDEIVKPSTKKQIDKILYHEKAIKLDSVFGTECGVARTPSGVAQ